MFGCLYDLYKVWNWILQFMLLFMLYLCKLDIQTLTKVHITHKYQTFIIHGSLTHFRVALYLSHVCVCAHKLTLYVLKSHCMYSHLFPRNMIIKSPYIKFTRIHKIFPGLDRAQICYRANLFWPAPYSLFIILWEKYTPSQFQKTLIITNCFACAWILLINSNL